MMKKWSFALIAVCLLLMSDFTAYADLIYEPDDDFYKQHQRQTVYLGRNFTSNGADESVSVRKEPGLENEIAKLPNGEVVFVLYSCLYDGDFWGFTVEYSGWIMLNQMLVLYDYVSFDEEHKGEFYSYNGDYAEIKESRSVVVWSWPGCDNYLWTFEDVDIENFRVSHAYIDNEDREWGFVTYMYGSSNLWICLSEPMNRDMPVLDTAPEPMPWVSETVHVDIKQYVPKKEFSTPVIVIILVAVLVIGAIVLIRVFWKLNKIEPGGKSDV
jgi:hypothetical protein